MQWWQNRKMIGAKLCRKKMRLIFSNCHSLNMISIHTCHILVCHFTWCYLITNHTYLLYALGGGYVHIVSEDRKCSIIDAMMVMHWALGILHNNAFRIFIKAFSTLCHLNRLLSICSFSIISDVRCWAWTMHN